MSNLAESPAAIESKKSSELFSLSKFTKGFATIEGRKTLWEILFVAPQLLLYLGLTIVPLLVSIPIVLSDRINFTDQNIDFVGLSNFWTIFQAPLVEQFIPSLTRTIILTLANYVMVFAFGLTTLTFWGCRIFAPPTELRSQAGGEPIASTCSLMLSGVYHHSIAFWASAALGLSLFAV